jgi:hypothetical protein
MYVYIYIYIYCDMTAEGRNREIATDCRCESAGSRFRDNGCTQQ